MKTLLAVLFLSVTASADLEITTYQGKTLTGAACSLTVNKVYFENSVRHPLNERVSVVAKFNDATSYDVVLSHPADVDSSKVEFNHDVLQFVQPTSAGAEAVILNMVHTAEKAGPDSMVLVQHNWKTDVRTLANCNGLTK